MEQPKTFNVKLCFDNEIHVIKLPDSLHTLRDLLPSIFLVSLPQNRDLIYTNSHNQEITLHSEQDFQALIVNELASSSKPKAVKIFVQEKKNGGSIQSSESGDYHILESQEALRSELNQADFPLLEKPKVGIEGIELVASSDFVKANKEDHFAEFEANMAIFKEKMQEAHQLMQQFDNQAQTSVPFCKSEYVLPPSVNVAVEQKPAQPKPKKAKASKASKTSVVEEQNLEEMVQKIIEKNILKIASMTSNVLQNQSQNKEVQPEEKLDVQAQQQVVHKTVRCNGCRAFPIVGVRYKCTVCLDYDLCEKCEATREHIHALIKIKYPGQTYRPDQRVSKAQKTFVLMQKPAVVVPGKKKEKPVEKKENVSVVNRWVSTITNVEFGLEPKIIQVAEEKPKVEEEVKVALKAENKEEEKPLEEEWEKPIMKKSPNREEKKKIYPHFVRNKAMQLGLLLPEANFEKILEFVDNIRGEMDIVEMMEMFQTLQMN